VFPLLNEGREAGASLPHSHSQLVWLPDPPASLDRPRAETVFERDGLTVACPWASRVPYEAVIAPSEPEPDAFGGGRLAPALKLLAEIVRRLSRLEGQVPLNAWLEQSPDDWRLVLFPRLNVLAALEVGAGVYINTLPPEEAVVRLRDA
jgi:UDPglucose--hexose-1-phosphate uridylyltransferase